MLASTIQFSKYGQEHQPRTTTYRADASNTRETTHPDQDTHTNGLVRAGPSHPSNCHQLNRDPRRNRSNPQRKHPLWAGPDSSGPNSAPRRSTQPHPRSTLTSEQY